MASTVWEELREILESELRKIETALGKGAANDYPSYREDVGRIRGLRSAAQKTEDLERKYMEDHDE